MRRCVGVGAGGGGRLLLLLLLCWSRQMASDGMKSGGAGSWGGDTLAPNIEQLTKRKNKLTGQQREKRKYKIKELYPLFFFLIHFTVAYSTFNALLRIFPSRWC